MDAQALVAAIVEQQLPPLAPRTPLNAIQGWDSLATVLLVGRLEEILGRELDETELERLVTLEDIENLLQVR
ncbi:MAG TPA: acyl carrier protein [Gemmatimonadaceae bacterium]|nr:acyl carrier protein [Gemmatimonadaceae bacterium]